MQGLLEPRGDAAPEVYWVRRLVVAVVTIAVVALVVSLLSGAFWGKNAVGTPVPGPASPSGSGAATLAPTQTPTPSGAGTATTSATPSGAGTATTSATPSGAGTATVSATPSGSGSATASESPTAQASASSSATATPQPSTASPQPPAGPAACDPAQVGVTIAGQHSVRSTENEVLTLSLVNHSKVECVLTYDPQHYSVVITSGADEIWSSLDCGYYVGSQTVTLKPEEAHQWDAIWNTRRSLGSCKESGQYLQPGTYVATARYQGAQPAKLVMELHG